MLGQFRICNIGLLLTVFLLQAAPVWAAGPVPTPHLSRSLDIQRQYQNKLRGDEVLELSNAQERFIALIREQQTSTPQGGLLILHDEGHSPDWPFLLRQVREYMPQVGWTTLAIDLPTPQRDAVGFLPSDENDTSVAQNTETQNTTA